MNKRTAVCNIAPVANISLNEDLEEILECIVITSLVNDANTPGRERLRIGLEELFTAEVPAA
jgi:hypothetical protein